MNVKKTLIVIFLAASLINVPSCKMFKNLIPRSFEIETTSELGPDTLERVDKLNDTLATGIEIGPETRVTIEELNRTIDEGLEFGFTDSTLQRVDILLSMIEEGVGIKAGLDAETNRTVNHLIDTLDDQPGQWENTMTEIITALEGSSSRVADQMADEVGELMVEARVNTQQLSASMGAEFRCNVDFMSARAGDTLDQFIGRSLVGRLTEIITGEEVEEEDEIPTPWVCQIIPDQIDLEEVDEELVSETEVVRVSGYNFVDENLPVTYIVDESGRPVESVELYTYVHTPYQVHLNIQDLDFSAVPTRSRVVFEWPMTGSSCALAMVLPSAEPTQTVEAVPELVVSADEVIIRKGPAETYLPIGNAVRGARYEVTGHNGDETWWQIDYLGDPGWVPDAKVTRNELPVGTASLIPFDPPEADFNYTMDPESGEAPLVVMAENQSQGNPTAWYWYLIEEDGIAIPIDGCTSDILCSVEIEEPGTYTLKLAVSNDLGRDEVEKEILVKEPPITFLPGFFEPIGPLLIDSPTPMPSYTSNSFLFENFVYISPKEYKDTMISALNYNCAIVSMAAIDGNIKCDNFGNIISAYLYPLDRFWHIYTNFRTNNNNEEWSVGLMCVEKEMSMLIEDIRITPLESSRTVSLASHDIPESYTCAISGFEVPYGSIANHAFGDMIKVFTERNEEGIWQVTADFLNDGDDEEWSVDVLCFYDDPDLILNYDDPETELPVLYPTANGFKTNVIASDYACGIVGMQARDGGIKCKKTGDILRAYTYWDGGWWHVFTDFRATGSTEKWDVDMLCVHRSIVEDFEAAMEMWRGRDWIKFER